MSTSTTGWMKLAVAGGVLCGLGEFALAPTMDGPAGIGFAVAFGIAFLVGALWTRNGRLRGAVLITVLAAIELAFMPMYERTTTAQWLEQGSFAVASAIALVGGLGVIVQSRRSRRSAIATAGVAG